jgi:FdhE protein
MTASALDDVRPQLDALARAHPEWHPWMAALAFVLDERADPAWDAASVTLVQSARRSPDAPLLTGARITLQRAAVERVVRSVLRLAADPATPSGAALQAVAGSEQLDVLAVLEAALDHDLLRLDEQATAVGIEPATLRALVLLATVPLLQACGRAHATAIPASWQRGYCPVCGAWPALAESRGLERERWLRCGRCGSGWRVPTYMCPYCDNRETRQLGSLLPDGQGESRRVEICRRCHGYLKNLATIRAWKPAEVLLIDLQSVELDVAALDMGYTRPTSPGFQLALRLTTHD